MKQIKDVGVLKKLLPSGGVFAGDYISSIIDSLAVEVPEDRSGALDALFEIVNYVQDRMSGELKNLFEEIVGPARVEFAKLRAQNMPDIKSGAIVELIDNYNSDYTGDGEFPNEFFGNRVKAARAELAQLQAEIDRWKEKTAEEKVKYSEQCSVNRNLKGALRTLAKMHYVCCPDCIMSSVDGHGIHTGCGDSANCESKLIAYALANPTEEVEG